MFKVGDIVIPIKFYHGSYHRGQILRVTQVITEFRRIDTYQLIGHGPIENGWMMENFRQALPLEVAVFGALWDR